eukprot:TRINITY_DN94_c0_g2_i2.p1 TRINITY_DN94_c0_g2~~TRINITY_DN94_c0_g2_i2.p1  ORF type:complete len:727 (-),score=210.67 TRINITY_DN94_c0_g2_i2:493-2673(-)
MEKAFISPFGGENKIVKEKPLDDKNRKAKTLAEVAKMVNHFTELLKEPFHISRDRPFMQYWDMITLTTLGLVAFFTPLEVALFNEPDDQPMALLILNRCFDVVFWMDLFVNFFLAYEENGRKITSRKKIAKRYLKFWFWVDFLSCIPFDLLARYNSQFKSMKSFRVIRLMRLLRLAKIMGASKFVERWHIMWGVRHSTVKLVTSITAVVALGHWLACLWYFAADSDYFGEETNWVTSGGYDTESEWTCYLTSVYWSVMTLSTIGYGDISATNNVERVVAIIAMSIGGATYAYVVSSLCGLVANMDPASTAFDQDSDHLNQYVGKFDMPNEFKYNLRRYFKQCRPLYFQRFYNDVITNMSPALRSQVASKSHGWWISKIWFLNAANSKERDEFIAQIAMRMKMVCFAQNEILIKFGETPNNMYVVESGVLASLGRIYRSGNAIGEDVILRSGKRLYTARALTHSRVFILTRDDIDNALKLGMFPQTQKLIDHATAWMTLKSNLKQFAVKELVENVAARKRYVERHGRLPRIYREYEKLDNAQKSIYGSINKPRSQRYSTSTAMGLGLGLDNINFEIGGDVTAPNTNALKEQISTMQANHTIQMAALRQQNEELRNLMKGVLLAVTNGKSTLASTMDDSFLLPTDTTTNTTIAAANNANSDNNSNSMDESIDEDSKAEDNDDDDDDDNSDNTNAQDPSDLVEASREVRQMGSMEVLPPVMAVMQNTEE